MWESVVVFGDIELRVFFFNNKKKCFILFANS